MATLTQLIAIAARKLGSLARTERGAVSVEYGVVAVFIAAVIVVAVVFLGASANGNFECTGRAYASSSSC